MSDDMATETTSRHAELRPLLARHGVSACDWFAVLDAAQEASMPDRARMDGLMTRSLYAGALGERLAHVAPHLTAFRLDGEFAQWLLDRWGGHHGILIQTQAGFGDLHRHLRSLLLARDERGVRYRFRFYDPRVLRAFLPACNRGEIERFFGPVRAFYAETRDGCGVLAHVTTTRGLAVRELRPGEKER